MLKDVERLVVALKRCSATEIELAMAETARKRRKRGSKGGRKKVAKAKAPTPARRKAPSKGSLTGRLLGKGGDAASAD